MIRFLTFASAILLGMAIGFLIVAFAGAGVGCIPSGGDGDSFYCGSDQVRVLSIDTPEDGPWTNQNGVLKNAECWGVKATKARKLLTALGPVTLAGSATDSHGRLLRHVTLADGRDLGAVLIAQGDAALFKGVDNGTPDYNLYAPLQVAAQAAPVGMWASCGNPPGHNGRLVP